MSSTASAQTDSTAASSDTVRQRAKVAVVLSGGGDWLGHYVEQQMPFAGIGNIEYVSHHFVAAQLQAQQRIGSNNYVLLRVAGAQQSDRFKELLDYGTLLGTQIAYYYNTIAGPVGATLGYSNRTKKPYFFLNLGYEF